MMDNNRYNKLVCYANNLKLIDLENTELKCKKIDPDDGYKNEEHKMLYERLTLFLNYREKELISENNRFEYSFSCGNNGIEVKKDNTTLFFLRTDLFGFASPEKKDRYPYDICLKECADKNDILRCAYETRTIGGFFLWPVSKYGEKIENVYNKLRGGKIPRFNGRYMQDRVDLALLEIKHIYSDMYSNYQHDILFKQMNDEDNHMKEWICHFGDSFAEFVNFFHFDDFVELKGNSIVGVKSLINGEQLLEICRENEELPSDSIRLKAILERLSNLIKKRSLWIEDYIDNCKKKEIKI